MNATGTTLTELLAAIAVAAVLTSLALPPMQRLIQQHQSTAAINQLTGTVQFVRHAAITHGAPVSLCPSIDHRTCAGRNQWHLGALAFVDHNRNGQIDTDDVVLRGFPGFADGSRVYWRSFRNRNHLSMTARGFTDWQNGHFLYCPADGDASLARSIIVNAQGRVRQARDWNGDGFVQDAQGRPVACP